MLEYQPDKSNAKRRVYRASDLDEAKAFVNKYGGSYFEYLPDVYTVII